MDELEKLKNENAQLRQTIKELRRQLEAYQKQSRRQYETERDHLPYHEYERE